MKKMLVLMLLCLLLLPGCTQEGEITNSLRKEIQQAYRKEFKVPNHIKFSTDDSDTIAGMEFYGIYNDYAILFEEGQLCIMSSYTVADQTFKWGSNFNLYAYKDDQFFDLRDIYDAGDITEEQIAEIAAVHKANFSKHHNWSYDIDE